jgi:hypothetical protein
MNSEYLTWESFLNVTWKIIRSNFGVKDCKITFSRDIDYRIKFSLEIPLPVYQNNRFSLFNRNKNQRLIAFHQIPNKRIYISRLFPSVTNTKGDIVTINGEVIEFTHYLRPKIKTKYYTIYYFLNSPKNFPYPGSANYESKKNISYMITNFVHDEIETHDETFYRNSITLKINGKDIAIVPTDKINEYFSGIYIRTKFDEKITDDELTILEKIFSYLTATKHFYLG